MAGYTLSATMQCHDGKRFMHYSYCMNESCGEDENMMLFRTTLIALICIISNAAFASDETVSILSLEAGTESPAATIGDIAWLAGHWRGKGLGGSAEDIIAPATDGQMMGMFRHSTSDGSVNFYEFYVFAEKDGSLTQRLKHFSPLLSGWEAKDDYVEFPLVKLEKQAAYFDGLTYLLADDGSLRVGVRLDENSNAVFHYQNVD